MTRHLKPHVWLEDLHDNRYHIKLNSVDENYLVDVFFSQDKLMLGCLVA